MKNYLFKLSAFSLFYLFCSCSQDTMNTSYYEEYGDNHWSSLTRSFSVEEDKIAAEIQEKLDSIGALYGKEVLLVKDCDFSKFDDNFFDFVEKSLCLDNYEASTNMIFLSNENCDTLMDDSSINRIKVRATPCIEEGHGAIELNLKSNLCIGISWSVGTIIKTTITSHIIYDLSRYSIINFTHTPPVGPYNNVTFHYTITIYDNVTNSKTTYTGMI